MKHPLEIALRDIPGSAALERHIGDEARKLDAICDRIGSCQVVAEALQPAQARAAQYSVHLIITLPGTEVVVNREHGDDIYMAVREAFAAAGLQLQDYMRRRGERRPHDGSPDSRR